MKIPLPGAPHFPIAMAEGYYYKRQESSDEESSDLSSAGQQKQQQRRRQQQQQSLDWSYLDLDSATLQDNVGYLSEMNKEPKDLSTSACQYLYLQHNRLNSVPENVSSRFAFLKHLDVSHNALTEFDDSLLQLSSLKSLVARHNLLGDCSLPKKLGSALPKLEELNLSGNLLRSLPPEIIDLPALRALYLGGNQIEEVPPDICKLEKLEVLYLGGNQLKEIPAEMGRLRLLKSLVLCENQLQSLPSTISCLRRLQSLALHKNQLTTLPPEIVTLKGLVELSLRDNPLVGRFVQELTYDPPSLRELAARCVKTSRVPYCEDEVPASLAGYLRSACRCVNPKCRGVYFEVRVEHIKFVDFCGKYRIPLLQYLCSPRCTIQSSAVLASNSSDSNSSDEEAAERRLLDIPSSRLRRVLLG